MPASPDLRIRKAVPADLDQIRQLFYDTVRSINTKDYSPAQIEIWSANWQNMERWEKAVEDQYFFVAMIGEKITGFASITPEGYLDFMYVHKDFQGRGVASALYEKIENVAEKLRLQEIWSHVSITARPFFKSRGFHISETFITKVGDIEFEDCAMRKVRR